MDGLGTGYVWMNGWGNGCVDEWMENWVCIDEWMVKWVCMVGRVGNWVCKDKRAAIWLCMGRRWGPGCVRTAG